MKIEKALTFRASSIGDCLMGKYLLENIHLSYPRARLGIVVAGRAEMVRDLFAAYPWLEIIEVNRRKPKALVYLIREFYNSDFIFTQYAGKQGGKFSFFSKLVARLLSRRGGLVGFSDRSKWNALLYDRLIPVSSGVPVVEHDQAALSAVSIPIKLPLPTLNCLESDDVLKKFSLERGKFMLVHLFAGNASRGLHPSKKEELLRSLAVNVPGITLVVSGGHGDRVEALEISKNIRALVVAGEVTLQDMMNLIKNSATVVSLDTGMAHITAQLGRSLVVLRTCVGRNWWFPKQYDENTDITVFSRDEVCTTGHNYSGYARCLEAIDVSHVVIKVKEFLL